MREFANNAFGRWVIFGLTIVAFLIAFKFVLTYLPDAGILGAFKTVGMAA